ncbi:hypothetical protein [Bacillus sp. FJAT-45066]|uniref:hypothetical protein n=1 Tax=Bacillus sp. FJAT-45066 TaxID=2011010 RepID=UPI000BB8D12C|nr:hypothetical protein [Bacillus sp. FJAT-45066]
MRGKSIIFTFIGVILVASFLLLWNPHVRGVVKIHATNSSYALLTDSGNKETLMSKWDDGEGLFTILNELETNGWQLEEQTGNLFLYVKLEEVKIVTIKKWTNHYVVAEIVTGG